MATKLSLIVLSIVMLHLLMSAQMHPIHSKSPAPQPHPPQSQPHHNSSQNGTTEGSLQLQGTYGNKQVCPCYNNWKTKLGGPKCP
ncbi:hypothetical protein HA466_0021810 [Hirschfeldia incana]|nr:hypothetical protein HA466_0021810 [Hirschfeldia incana]